MSTREVQPPVRYPELPGWDPEKLLEEIAARRGITVEELQRQIRETAEQSRRYAKHVSFEHARDSNLTDEELRHVEECTFCADLLQAIRPTEEAIRDVERLLEAQLKHENEQSSAGKHGCPQGGRQPYGWAAMSLVLAGVALWLGFRSSGESTQLLRAAAEFQQEGNTAVTDELVIKGLEKAGLEPEALRNVRLTLRSSGHGEVNGYSAVAEYLDKVEPTGRATRAYKTDFFAHIARAEPSEYKEN